MTDILKKLDTDGPQVVDDKVANELVTLGHAQFATLSPEPKKGVAIAITLLGRSQIATPAPIVKP